MKGILLSLYTPGPSFPCHTVLFVDSVRHECSITTEGPLTTEHSKYNYTNNPDMFLLS